MGKNAIQRADETITIGKSHPDVPVQKLFECIKRNLNDDLVRKQMLGEALSLGYYTGSSAAKTNQRHLVRAALLLQLTIGGMGSTTKPFKNERDRLLKLSDVQLQGEIRNLQQTGPVHTPNLIETIEWSNDTASRDGILHRFKVKGTSANPLHLAYIATREFVVYTKVRYKNGAERALTRYGGAKNFPADTHAPWFPHAATLGDFASPPNPTLKGPFPNGVSGSGTDTHSFGPQGATVNALSGVLGTPLVECELVAKQVYQYNATCDPDKWVRDSPLNKDVVANVHANDQYWTDFPGDGRWLITRRIYQGPGQKWFMDLIKQGNQGSNSTERYTRTSAIGD